MTFGLSAGWAIAEIASRAWTGTHSTVPRIPAPSIGPGPEPGERVPAIDRRHRNAVSGADGLVSASARLRIASITEPVLA